ncbi:MBL fold metallo-hydrolase [Bacillus salitolerans]|uniref:MBL fold metallo-hydrolase n=1 Tax=Bacillus salitolerans TaxID=1437434 RepID=A0ABW4LVB0_9BACI
MRNSAQAVNRIHCITIPTPFAVGDVNVYLVESEKLTLVDAGVKTEEAYEQFKTQLGELGYQVEDIDQVIITHHHPDHVGLLDMLPEHLPVYGHRFNKPWLRLEPDFLEYHDEFYNSLFINLGLDESFLKLAERLKDPLAYMCKRQLTYELKENDNVPGLPGWTVLETPGHAQSHIALYHEGEGLLIGGDVLIKHISSNPLFEPPMEGDKRPKTLLQYNHSLRKIKDLDLSIVFSGHGENIDDVSSLITERLHKQEKRAELVLEMLKEKPMTALEVCKQLFPQIYKREIALTLSETLGQLDFLEEEDYIKVENDQTPWIFYAKGEK